MKGKAVSFGLPYLAAIAGAAGYFFRAAQRAGGSAVPVIAFSVLMCLLFLLGAAMIAGVVLLRIYFAWNV